MTRCHKKRPTFLRRGKNDYDNNSGCILQWPRIHPWCERDGRLLRRHQFRHMGSDRDAKQMPDEVRRVMFSKPEARAFLGMNASVCTRLTSRQENSGDRNGHVDHRPNHRAVGLLSSARQKRGLAGRVAIQIVARVKRRHLCITEGADCIW